MASMAPPPPPPPPALGGGASAAPPPPPPPAFGGGNNASLPPPPPPAMAGAGDALDMPPPPPPALSSGDDAPTTQPPPPPPAQSINETLGEPSTLMPPPPPPALGEATDAPAPPPPPPAMGGSADAMPPPPPPAAAPLSDSTVELRDGAPPAPSSVPEVPEGTEIHVTAPASAADEIDAGAPGIVSVGALEDAPEVVQVNVPEPAPSKDDDIPVPAQATDLPVTADASDIPAPDTSTGPPAPLPEPTMNEFEGKKFPVISPNEKIPSDAEWVKAEFIWLEGAERDVQLCPSWVDWIPLQMTKGPDGIWAVVTRCPVGERAFNFLVDGNTKISRHHTVAQDENGVMMNTRVVKPVVSKPLPQKEEREEIPLEKKKGWWSCFCPV
mmetsp:Transcript_281/g.913  ORF Transcript_281/g.913 Transcript_281/m.913 type:complete len:383 (+) Transcript_281:236-1384(+)